MISSNDSEGGSTELDHRLSSRMSMRSCPAGKGSRTWIAEAGEYSSQFASVSIFVESENSREIGEANIII